MSFADSVAESLDWVVGLGGGVGGSVKGQLIDFFKIKSIHSLLCIHAVHIANFEYMQV